MAKATPRIVKVQETRIVEVEQQQGIILELTQEEVDHLATILAHHVFYPGISGVNYQIFNEVNKFHKKRHEYYGGVYLTKSMWNKAKQDIIQQGTSE